MAIYTEILTWANTKPDFIKDALRRLISSSAITQTDIDELILLLKKENGDTTVLLNAIPINNTHIPTTVATGTVYPKLISIKDPINVCALHNQGHLQFLNSGLTVVYGNNGSGKSSYSRILKKLCWSRNPNVELKKNVFSPSASRQKVDFIIEVNGISTPFQWLENSPTHPALGSVFVYDNDCGNVYVNNENPTQYKPIGIDVLERLVLVLNDMSQKLSSEIAVYNTQKPILDQSIIHTATGQWYSNIESKTRNDVENYIQFTQTDLARKRQLSALINSQNPQQTNQTLTNLKNRLVNYIQQFKRIEERFNNQEIEEIRNLRSRYESTSQAYNIATNELNGLNTMPGFGTNPWRTLWNAAKDFANNNGLTDNLNFPSNASLEKCVLCQQELDESAQQRLLGFSRFILNDVSKQLSVIEREIQTKVSAYNTLSIPAIENFMELNEYITDFQNWYSGFSQSINSLKDVIINYLQNGGALNISPCIISTIIDNLLPGIDIQLEQNRQLLNDRSHLVIEYNVLTAKEFLFNNKAVILQYFDEYKYKSWIGRCQSQLNTNIVSRRIGEFMQDQAVTLQHQEFINHLSFFNQDLSSKVLISKTRTTHGSTFQKCGLNGITHSIDSVLSEGEKKVIALSNFLADCTIDNRKNTIVFDDPVTSLDMDYRDLIATKIVELSRDRQIIVLTHDLYFVRLLLDIHKKKVGEECFIVGVEKNRGVAGIVSDEIPYLAKNIQERINSIRRDLNLIDSLPLNQTQRIEEVTEKLKKQFRKLLEKSVEDILANESIKRFSKNIILKAGYLSGYVIVEHSDIRLLLDLFGKYSITEHDGGIEVQGNQIAPNDIRDDLRQYEDWKNDFSARLSTFKTTHNYR